MCTSHDLLPQNPRALRSFHPNFTSFPHHRTTTSSSSSTTPSFLNFQSPNTTTTTTTTTNNNNNNNNNAAATNQLFQIQAKEESTALELTETAEESMGRKRRAEQQLEMSAQHQLGNYLLQSSVAVAIPAAASPIRMSISTLFTSSASDRCTLIRVYLLPPLEPVPLKYSLTTSLSPPPTSFAWLRRCRDSAAAELPPITPLCVLLYLMEYCSRS